MPEPEAPATPPASPPPPPPPPAPPAEPAPTPTATLTKDDVDRAEVAASAKGKRDALKALADELGMSIEEAKKLVTDTKAREQAALSEVERREQAAEAREQAAKDAEAAAKARERTLAVKDALTDAGVRADRREQAVALVALEPDAGAPEIATAVEVLKTGVPEFFGDAAAPGAPRLPASVPTGGKPGTGGAADPDPFAAGASEAKKRLDASRNRYYTADELNSVPA